MRREGRAALDVQRGDARRVRGRDERKLLRLTGFAGRYRAATAALALVSCLAPAAAQAQAQVTVNGSVVDIAPPPIIDAGRVFVPLRGVFEQLGASVVYADGTINATGNGREISLQIGSTQATVNGQAQAIDVAPFIVGSSTFVPLRFVSEALGDSVTWDEADQIAAIDTGGGSATYFSPGTASYVDTPPPPVPEYQQPYVPEPNDIWQPGYWAWGRFGYYWVPGTWVQAPQTGYLWTPGYWQWNNYGYNWNPGYWAVAVGFYGGVNYGGGYFGHGYDGGRWSHNRFSYNSDVSRVSKTNITNVYADRNVDVNGGGTRVSYNGGRGGIAARPSAQEASVGRDRHLGMTDVQRGHVQAAEQDRRFLATATHNQPAVLAVARPLSRSNPPAGFVAVKPSDRVNPLANVAPVHVPPARSAAHPAILRGAAPAPAPMAHAPAARAEVDHAPAPPAHAPAATVPVGRAPAAHAPIEHPPAAIAPVARVTAAVPPTNRAPANHAAPMANLQAVRPAPPARAAPVRAAPAPAANAPPAARPPAEREPKPAGRGEPKRPG